MSTSLWLSLSVSSGVLRTAVVSCLSCWMALLFSKSFNLKNSWDSEVADPLLVLLRANNRSCSGGVGVGVEASAASGLENNGFSGHAILDCDGFSACSAANNPPGEPVCGARK